MKWVLIVAGALVLLVVLVVAAVPYLVDLPQIQGYLGQSASQALGRPVKFASLSLSLLPLPAVVLKDLQVAEDPRFGDGAFLRVGEGRFRLRLGPLLARRVELGDLTLERPRLRLARDAAGRWNVASLGAGAPARGAPAKGAGRGQPAAAALPVISRLRILDGAVDFEARPRKGSAASYRLEGLGLTLRGLGSGEPVDVAGQARVNPGGVLVKLEGTLSPPPDGAALAAAGVSGSLSLDGKDVAGLMSLLLGSSRALGGPVKGSLALAGTLGRLAVQGQLDSTRLTLAERRPNCSPPGMRRLVLEPVRAPLGWDGDRLTSAPLSAGLGGGSISLSLALALEPKPLLSLREITIRSLPLEPVLVDYLCQGYAVTGPLDLAGELRAHPGDLLGTVAGEGQLKIGPGKVVGRQALALFGGVVRVGGALSSVLNLDLPLSIFSSPLHFRSITATYRIAGGRVSTRDLLYTSDRMMVSAAGEYGLADGRVNADVVLTSGRGRIKARVTGTAASPSIRVLPGSILRTEPERVPGRLQQFLEELTK